MNNIYPFLPLCLIITIAIIVMILEVFMTKHKEILAYVSLGGVAITALSTAALWNKQESPFRLPFFDEMFVVDNYSLFFYLIFLLCAAITIFTSVGYLRRENLVHGEFYSLILFAVSGMMLMASGGDLLVLFLGLEIMSISIYVLVGFRREDSKSNEATLKYFFLGAFSAGFILYGIALIYGSCGTTSLVQIRQAITAENFSYNRLVLAGILMIMVGVLFKVAAVPFHIWLPDIYEGAPAPVTGFMITAVKAASFALFLRIFLVSFIDLNGSWKDIISVISVITMFIGNIFAFTQENIKRMLAYSSISHTGYLLIGIAALSVYPSNTAADAILFYLVAYSVSSLGIFACITYLSQKNEQYTNIEDYAGLGFKYPLIGIAISLFMFSLIGVPPTGGFFGKYYLFSAALNQGLFSLVLVGIINSMMSIYYYLRVVAVMYLKEPVYSITDDMGKTSTNIVLIYTMVGTLWLGVGTFTLFSVIPGAFNVIEWTKISIESLF
jgi:NADH-quinone oxidoreductase subunit N